MTPDYTPDAEMSNAADFEAALGQLLLTALQRNIDPRGTWEYRSNGPNAAMEVMVLELAE